MDYILKRNSRQKNLRMHFTDKGQLIVSAPNYVSSVEIEKFVTDNGKWIEENSRKYINHSYDSGDNIPFLGQNCNLLVIKGSKYVRHIEGCVLVSTVHTDNIEGIKKQLRDYYAEVLLGIVREKVSYWTKKMSIGEPSIEITNAKTYWGICYKRDNLIKFSAIAAALKDELLDMIVVHELCHLRYDNHSQQFWNLVRSYVPDVDEKEKELKKFSKTGIVRNLF